MTKHITLLIATAVLIVFSILYMVNQSANNEKRINFKLSDTNGGAATHKNLWGKWTVLTFGFTNCPDVCPTHAARIGAAMYELNVGTGGAVSGNEKGENQFQAVFISVDHLRDTAGNLDKYLKFFHPSYIGYLGDSTQLDQVTKSFKVAYSVTKGAGTEVNVLHSSLIYIIDPYGRIAKQLPFGSSTELIVSEVKKLI